MKFTEYISTHHVFTTADLLAASDSAASAEQQLGAAVRSGSVERARRGLLVSNHGRFEGAMVDPYTVVSAGDPNAILRFHSALEAHGVTHNVGFECRFLSDSIRTSFEFRGIRYIPCGPATGIPSVVVRGGSVRRRATTKERTIVDCLGSPGKAGGPEEVVRCITAFAYIDADALADMACSEGPSAAARIGWLLVQKADDWHVGEDVLARLDQAISGGPYRFGRASYDGGGFSPRWRLILPATNKEVESWITRF